MADEHQEPQSEPTPPAPPEPPRDPAELSEEELDKISGGAACAKGKHLNEATLT